MVNTKEKEYMQALAEVSCILKYTDLELVKKIPSKFLEHIENKKDKNFLERTGTFFVELPSENPETKMIPFHQNQL